MQGRVQFEVRVGPRRGRSVLGPYHPSGLGRDARALRRPSGTACGVARLSWPRRRRRVRGDGDATPSTPSIGAATGRRKTDAAKGPLEVLTGAPSIDISFPDAFSSNSTCALPLLQLAKWPQCDLMECWAACQFRWTSPPRSHVASSHNAHFIIEPSTTSCRFSLPSLAVNRLPTTP